jgi:hypothetical protein
MKKGKLRHSVGIQTRDMSHIPDGIVLPGLSCHLGELFTVISLGADQG